MKPLMKVTHFILITFCIARIITEHSRDLFFVFEKSNFLFFKTITASLLEESETKLLNSDGFRKSHSQTFISGEYWETFTKGETFPHYIFKEPSKENKETFTLSEPIKLTAHGYGDTIVVTDSITQKFDCNQQEKEDFEINLILNENQTITVEVILRCVLPSGVTEEKKKEEPKEGEIKAEDKTESAEDKAKSDEEKKDPATSDDKKDKPSRILNNKPFANKKVWDQHEALIEGRRLIDEFNKRQKENKNLF